MIREVLEGEILTSCLYAELIVVREVPSDRRQLRFGFYSSAYRLDVFDDGQEPCVPTRASSSRL